MALIGSSRTRPALKWPRSRSQESSLKREAGGTRELANGAANVKIHAKDAIFRALAAGHRSAARARAKSAESESFASRRGDYSTLEHESSSSFICSLADCLHR